MDVGVWIRQEIIVEAGRMVAASFGFGAAAADERAGRCQDVLVYPHTNLGGKGN